MNNIDRYEINYPIIKPYVNADVFKVYAKHKERIDNVLDTIWIAIWDEVSDES